MIINLTFILKYAWITAIIKFGATDSCCYQVLLHVPDASGAQYILGWGLHIWEMCVGAKSSLLQQVNYYCCDMRIPPNVREPCL